MSFKKLLLKINVYLLGLLFVATNSCQYLDYLGKDGEVIIQEQDILPFKSLVVDAPYHIHLVHSNEEKVVFEGLDYLMKDMVITESDDVLTLDHLKSQYIHKSKKIKATIYSSNFSNVTINKPVKFTSQEALEGNSLYVVYNGGATFSEMNLDLRYTKVALNVYGLDHVGNYALNGTCNELRLNFEGSSNVNAEGLQSQNCYVNHKSINYCKVNCSSALSVKVHNVGNTYFIGEPEITIEKISASGLLPLGKVLGISNY